VLALAFPYLASVSSLSLIRATGREVCVNVCVCVCVCVEIRERKRKRDWRLKNMMSRVLERKRETKKYKKNQGMIKERGLSSLFPVSCEVVC